jgi:hypothetical protein
MATKANHSPLINIFAEANRIADRIGSSSDSFIRLLCLKVSLSTGFKVSPAKVYGHAQSVYVRKVS